MAFRSLGMFDIYIYKSFFLKFVCFRLKSKEWPKFRYLNLKFKNIRFQFRYLNLKCLFVDYEFRYLNLGPFLILDI